VPVEFAQVAQSMKISDEDYVPMTSSSKLSKKRYRSYQDQYLDHQKQESQYNKMKGEHNILIIGLDPNKYKEVKSNKTYLWINGEHRVKDVVRVSKPIKSKYATKDYFDETIELDAVTDEKMTVRFSRSKLGKGTAVRRKYPREQPTIFLSGSIMLKSNFEIKKLELLDKHMKPVRNKKYQCVLYDDTTEHHSVIYQSSQVSKKPRVSPGLGHSLSKAVKREKWELFDEEGNSKIDLLTFT